MTFPLPRSLRARVTAASVLAAAFVLALAAFATILVHRGQLIDRIDDSLEREAVQVVAEIEDDPGRTRFIIGRPGDDRFVQLIDGDRQVWAASAEVLQAEPVMSVGGSAWVRREIDDVPLEDDHYRVLGRPANFAGTTGWIIVGENTDDVSESIVGLFRTFALLMPVATALLGAVAWFMVGRTLRPVASIRRQVGEISLNRLGARVPVPASRDEIAELASTMNSMLDRLDQANERQQRFVADASHELRSPLTRLRTSLEVDLADPSRNLNMTGAELIADIDDLQHLIDELLFLARRDVSDGTSFRSVELDAVVDRVVGKVATHEGVMIDSSDVAPVVVLGDESQLTRLADNLVANALRHSDSLIWIQSHEVDSRVVLVVEDNGPGVQPQDRARIFDRFTRLDESRTGATGGSGLGLAIVASIAAMHGADVVVEVGRTGGARFVVTFPPVTL